MAAVKAADAVYGVTPPRGRAEAARAAVQRLLRRATTRRTSTRSAGPTSSSGPTRRRPSGTSSGWWPRSGLELGAEVIRQRARGQRVVQIIGGKALHPVTALPGGMSKRVTKEEQQELIRIGREMVEFGKTTIKVFEDIVLKNKAYVDLILSEMFTPPDLLDRPRGPERQGQLLRRHGPRRRPRRARVLPLPAEASTSSTSPRRCCPTAT